MTMSKIMLLFLTSACPFITMAQVGQITVPADSASPPLSVSATGYYYFFPKTADNTLTLIGYLDYKSVHFEPRYNYEGQNTGSVFAGWKFESEGNINLAVTPMIGIVFGGLKGFAPALELELSYKAFDFYTENEYIIDQAGSMYNFFYAWTELGFSPVKKLRTGISIQRSRLYENRSGHSERYICRIFILETYRGSPLRLSILSRRNIFLSRH